MKQSWLKVALLSALLAAVLGLVFTRARATSTPSSRAKEHRLEPQPKKKQFLVAVYARCTFEEPPKSHMYVIPAKDGYATGHCATTDKEDGAIGYTTNVSEEKSFPIDGSWSSEIMVFVQPQ